MHTHIRYILVAALAAVAISTTSAAAATPGHPDRADRSRAGRLTWSEYVRQESKFDVLDGNSDGVITARDRFLADGQDESSWVYAASMDTNRSGAVTWAEYQEQLRATFARYDRNAGGARSARAVSGSGRVRAVDAGRAGPRELAARRSNRS
jgi:hypothetical protein